MKRPLLTIALSILTVLLLLALNISLRRTAAAELALTEDALAAVSEAATDLESLTLALDKLQLTTSLRHTAALLSRITLCADRVQQSLAELPDTQGQRSAIWAYLTQLSSLTQSSLESLAETAVIPAHDLEALSGMAGGTRLLLAELNLAQQDLLKGASITALPPSSLTPPPTAKELVTYKALPSQEINNGEALQAAKEFAGAYRVTSAAPAPDTAGALPAYGVTLQTPDLQLNLEVTRRGGKVLLMAPETASFSMVRSVKECTEAALAFLQSRGFASMEATYYQIYDGMCVLTCIYVQDGVLIWPDRVIVQVRMDTAEVVGLEARNYWRNHIPRRLQSPLLTQAEAKTHLSDNAEVDAARLCLLSHQNQERLCWQFSVTMEDAAYVICIDAITGQELLLEKVMQLEYGQVPA